MPVDFNGFCTFVGKFVVWGGTVTVALLVLLLIVAIPIMFCQRLFSTMLAKRYIKHWTLIRAYIGSQKADKDEFGKNSQLHQNLIDALTEGVKMYEATEGDGPTKLNAAMEAWCKAMDHLGAAKSDRFFMPTDPRHHETKKHPAIMEKH